MVGGSTGLKRAGLSSLTVRGYRLVGTDDGEPSEAMASHVCRDQKATNAM